MSYPDTLQDEITHDRDQADALARSWGPTTARSWDHDQEPTAAELGDVGPTKAESEQAWRAHRAEHRAAAAARLGLAPEQVPVEEVDAQERWTYWAKMTARMPRRLLATIAGELVTELDQPRWLLDVTVADRRPPFNAVRIRRTNSGAVLAEVGVFCNPIVGLGLLVVQLGIEPSQIGLMDPLPQPWRSFEGLAGPWHGRRWEGYDAAWPYVATVADPLPLLTERELCEDCDQVHHPDARCQS